MHDPNSELVKLRTSIARLAQQVGLGHHIPGHPADGSAMNFEQITKAAQTEERGWNALMAKISILIERVRPKAVTRGTLSEPYRTKLDRIAELLGVGVLAIEVEYHEMQDRYVATFEDSANKLHVRGEGEIVSAAIDAFGKALHRQLREHHGVGEDRLAWLLT